MSKVCAICGKGKMKGNQISMRSTWVTNRSLKAKNPNLHKVDIEIDGKVSSQYVCTKCMKGSKKDK